MEIRENNVKKIGKNQLRKKPERISMENHGVIFLDSLENLVLRELTTSSRHPIFSPSIPNPVLLASYFPTQTRKKSRYV